MPKYKIISVPVSIPYNFDGKSGVTVKLCVCSLAEDGSFKQWVQLCKNYKEVKFL